MSKYNSVTNIPAKLFFDILNTKDLSLLEKTDENEDLEEVFALLYDEYFIKCDNERAKDYLRLKNNIIYLTYKIDMIKKVLKFLFFNETTNEMQMELVDAFIEIGIYFDKKNIFKDEIKRVLQVELGIIENDLNMYKMELESLRPSEAEDKEFDFYKTIVNFETILERNLDDDMLLIKYINYEKICNEKIKTQTNQNNSRR